MKTDIVEVSATQREIKIEIEADAIKEVYQKVCQKWAKGAQIPGFRKGFAPLDVIKLRYKDEIQNEVLQQVLSKYVPQAIDESGQHPLSEPQLHLEDHENIKLNGSQPLSLHVHFDVMPEIPTPEYKGLEITRRIRPLRDGEMENIIEERRKQFATLVPVEDRASEKGDTLLVDLEGIFVDEPETDPIIANDVELNLGDDNIEESFTENLVGVKEEEEKEFTITYPEDFSSPLLAGKTVNYKAKIKSVGKLELPQLDDEWATSLDEGYESLEDLRNKLNADLELAAKADADARVRNDLMAKLIENHEFEVPNVLIENQSRNLLNNFAQDMQQRGVDLNKVENDFIQMAYGQMQKQAERDVRGAILLEKVAELENVQVSNEEIVQELQQMADYYRVSEEEIRKAIAKQGGEANIAHNLRMRKSVEAIFENAKITDGEWIDESLPKIETTEETKTETKGKKSKSKENTEAEKPKKKAAKKEK